RPLIDSCGRLELPRRDADKALEVMGEMALVREASPCRDLRQGEAAALQELLGPLDAAGEDGLGRRQPGGPPGRPPRVGGGGGGRAGGGGGVGASREVGDGGGGPPGGGGAARGAGGRGGRGGVWDRVEGGDVARRLGGEPPAGAARRQLGIHRANRGPQVWE